MSRRRRFVYLLFAALALAAALYLIGANLFLNTGLAFSLINRSPDQLYLRWSRGWSLAPGHVTLLHVMVRGQDGSLQWLAELDRADVSLRLAPLFGRHFHATSIRGSGLEFRLRRPRSESYDARFAPAIAGLSPQSLPEVSRSRRQPADAKKGGWRITLDSIDIAPLRLLWIDEHRLEGEGSVAGHFDYRIHGALSVDDAVLELHDATLRVGEEVEARALDATVTATLEPVVPERLEGLEVLDHLSGELTLDAEEASIGVINRYLERVPWLTVAGSGRLHSKARIAKGRIEPGSELGFASPRLSASFLDYQARGAGRLQGSVSAEQPPQTRIGVRLDDFEVRRHGFDQPHVRGKGFEIDMAADGLDLQGQAEEVSVEVRLPRSQVPDLSFYSAYLPAGSGAQIRAGSGTIEGSLRASTKADDGEGELHLQGTGVTLQFQNLTLEGDLDLAAHFTDFGIAARRLALDGSRLELRNVELAEGGNVEERHWHGSFDLTRGTLDFDELALDSTVKARLQDSRPIVAIIAEKAWLLDWFEGLLTVKDIDLESDIHVDSQALALDRLQVRGDNLEILARLRFEEQRRRGIVYVQWRALSVGLELGPEGRDWKLRQPRRWFVSRAGFGARSQDPDGEPPNRRRR